MRFIKFLLGVLVGAAAVSLVTPKTGRQMREQLLSGVGSRMLPAAPEYPEPSGERDWGTSATAVAEPPVAEAAPVEEAPAEEAPAEAAPEAPVEEAPVEEAPVEESVAEPSVEEAAPDEGVVTEESVEEAVAEVLVEEALAEAPAVAPMDESEKAGVAAEAPAEAPSREEQGVVEGEDLRVRIEETRAAVESELEQPFGSGEAQAEAVAQEQVEVPAAGSEAVAQAPVEEAVAQAHVQEAAPEKEAVSEASVEEAKSETRDGASVDQAEMRRRIEETRARLKAKAFDAMMSGESALLSRDSGEKPVPRASDVDIDDEAASAVDESLSPNDD